MRSLARDLCPPALLRWLQHRQAARLWSGDYPSWQAAAAQCEGYESGGILERVKEASLAVRDGRAVYERDSVLFHEPSYVWPLLAIMLEAAAANAGRLRVVDFGGALGSTYMQHRHWFAEIPALHWGVVEQPHFVAAGREHFENAQLHFHDSIAECADAAGGADVVLFSSVLQYLPDPWAFIEQAKGVGARSIVCDRTGFVHEGRERITVQHVPSVIYPASYPCRFFEQREMERRLAPYRLDATFPTLDRPTAFAEFRGLHFRRATSA